jgi:SulP family sulfate permease
MKNVNSMDATALNALKQLEKRCKSQKILILYAETMPQPQKLLTKSGFVDKIGKDHFFKTTEEAKKVAGEIIAIDYHSPSNNKALGA